MTKGDNEAWALALHQREKKDDKGDLGIEQLAQQMSTIPIRFLTMV